MYPSKKLLAILLCLVLGLTFALGVFAEGEIPPETVLDESIPGSLRVTMLTASGQPVPGGQLKLYLLARALHSDYTGDKLELEADYLPVASQLSLTNEGLSVEVPTGGTQADSNNAQTAKKLAEYLQEQGVAPTASGAVDETGNALFENLTLGLYLVVQSDADAATGYYPVMPFLVTVPGRQPNGYLDYAVDAAPKMQPIDPKPTPKPDGEVPNQPPVTGILPQTGQLNWPVPVLAVSGMVLFLLGWWWNRKQEH